MNYPVYCEYCGSNRLRRSRRQSSLEMAKMLIGTYPFRCQDCNGRFFVNVFLLSRLAYVKCPKCLSLDVTNSGRGHHLSLWRRLMMTFGARRVRCRNCRYMFVSFRPVAAPGRIEETIQTEEEHATNVSDVPLAAEDRHAQPS